MKISPYFLSAFVVLSASFAFAGSDGDSSFMPSKDRDKTGSNEVSTPDDRTKPTDSGERNLTIVLWAFHPGSG